MNQPTITRTIIIETRRGGFRHSFQSDVKGKPANDGTIVARNGMRWKV